MFEQKLTGFEELPVRQQHRKCTDVFCTQIGALFAFAIFVISLIVLNKENYLKTNFPTDSDYNPCAYGKNEKFSFLYFPDINDVSKRVCVSECPQSSDLQLSCKPNSKVVSCDSVNIYQTRDDVQRLGGFCIPEDSGAANSLINNANLQKKQGFLKTYDIIRLSLVISLIIGIVWVIFVQCMPKVMATAALILGSIILLVSGAILLLDKTKGWQEKDIERIVGGAILCLFGILFFAMLCIYRQRIKVTTIFMNYSTRFLNQKQVNFAFIPIFLILTVGLIVLCLFEYLAISSSGNTTHKQGDIYLHSEGSTVLTVLVIIQFIWGMQFLKDSFNFIISGNATQWYTRQGAETNCCLPVSRLIKYNFGSVAGGSFLNAFFNFIDFLFQTIRCYPGGCCPCCVPCSTAFSKCCGCFFDLVRNDAYAYINLTGIPYCNAARNCQVLCNSSKLFIGSQSVIFFYRLCAHIFCVGLATLISYGLMKQQTGGINIFTLLLIIFLSYCVVTYFIDIHADAAEGLQTSYLLDNDLGGERERILDFKKLRDELLVTEENQVKM